MTTMPAVGQLLILKFSKKKKFSSNVMVIVCWILEIDQSTVNEGKLMIVEFELARNIALIVYESMVRP